MTGKAFLPVKPGRLSPVTAIILGDSNTAQSHQGPLHGRHVLSWKPKGRLKPSACRGRGVEEDEAGPLEEVLMGGCS